MPDLSLICSGAIRVWSWCCGAPRRTLSLSSWRTLSRDSSVNSSRRADRPRHPPPPSLKGQTNTPSAHSPQPPAPQRRTWSYRLDPASIKLTFSTTPGSAKNVRRSNSWYRNTRTKTRVLLPCPSIVYCILSLQFQIVVWSRSFMSQGPHYYYSSCTSQNITITQIRCDTVYCDYMAICFQPIHYTGYFCFWLSSLSH